MGNDSCSVVSFKSVCFDFFSKVGSSVIGILTGKSLSEALIFASANPQYDDILFIELQVQYVKIPNSEHGENMLCSEIDLKIQNNLCKQHVLPHVLRMEFSCIELVIQ